LKIVLCIENNNKYSIEITCTYQQYEYFLELQKKTSKHQKSIFTSKNKIDLLEN